MAKNPELVYKVIAVHAALSGPAHVGPTSKEPHMPETNTATEKTEVPVVNPSPNGALALDPKWAPWIGVFAVLCGAILALPAAGVALPAVVVAIVTVLGSVATALAAASGGARK